MVAALRQTSGAMLALGPHLDKATRLSATVHPSAEGPSQLRVAPPHHCARPAHAPDESGDKESLRGPGDRIAIGEGKSQDAARGGLSDSLKGTVPDSDPSESGTASFGGGANEGHFSPHPPAKVFRGIPQRSALGRVGGT